MIVVNKLNKDCTYYVKVKIAIMDKDQTSNLILYIKDTHHEYGYRGLRDGSVTEVRYLPFRCEVPCLVSSGFFTHSEISCEFCLFRTALLLLHNAASDLWPCHTHIQVCVNTGNKECKPFDCDW